MTCAAVGRGIRESVPSWSLLMSAHIDLHVDARARQHAITAARSGRLVSVDNRRLPA